MPVEGCLLEFQHPTIPEAWQALIARGAQHIHVAPLLLFAAGHARADIPEIVFACAAMTPGISYDQCGPLSRAPSVVALSISRIHQAASDNQIQIDDSVALVMVGRGSYDPCAKADMRMLGEIVGHHCGIRNRSVGFYAMTEPKLPEVLDEVASRAGIRSVIIQPHLLFQGRLYDAIQSQVDQAAGRHPNVSFILGGYLGPTEAVAEALVRRAFSQACWVA